MKETFLVFTFLVSWIVGFCSNSLVVADRVSRLPLVKASILDKNGKALGLTDKNGRFTYQKDQIPLIVRYLGYKDGVFSDDKRDTLFLERSITELPEFTVISKKNYILHLLAFEREYSTLSTMTDTVFLFREKLVDFMINPYPKGKFRGWSTPRVIKSRSYYRFTNNQGLDSVSDKCNNHFSWSDWIGIPKMPKIPHKISSKEVMSETIMGRYSPAQVWSSNDSATIVNINLLADSNGLDYYPAIKHVVKDNLDFDKFKIELKFCGTLCDTLNPVDLESCIFQINSVGRGHEMFQFHKVNETFDVVTLGELYFIDREYISLKEAKEWERVNLTQNEFDFMLPQNLSELPSDVLDLIDRVNNVDHISVRTNLPTNQNLKGGLKARPQNIGQRALTLLKDLVGITSVKARRNFNKKWSDFKKERLKKNNMYD